MAHPPERVGSENRLRTTIADEERTAPVASAPVELVQLLDIRGTRTEQTLYDSHIDDLTPTRVLALYEDMLVVRRIDIEATALQRQGELGLWPPLAGQEAAQIGSARALRDDDFVFTSYREHAVAWCRGVGPAELLTVWRGSASSGWNPYEHGMAVPQIIIGAQALHATGWAMGAAWEGSDAASVAYFGDGATSEGDVNEALV